MNNIEFQRLNFDLEYLCSEQELKLHHAKIKYPETDYSDAENKIRMLKNIKIEFYNLFYEKENIVKSHIKIALQNELLIINNLELKK